MVLKGHRMRVIRNFVTQFIIGGVIGLMTGLMIFSIAVANISAYHIPHSYKTLLLSNAGIFRHIAKYDDLFVYILLALAVLSWFLVVRHLNPHLTPFPYHKTKKIWLAWLLVLLSGILFWSGLIFPGSFYERVSLAYFPVGRFIIGLTMITASWWLISAKGLARDFSYPIKIKESSWSEHTRTISFGALAAIIFFILITGTAHLLVASLQITEYMDRGVEAEARSGWFLIYLTSFLLGSLFAIIAGLVPALDASDRNFRERISGIKPTVAYLGVVLIVLAVYVPYARSTHHFGKENLADVLQLTRADYTDRAILILGSEMVSKNRRRMRYIARKKSDIIKKAFSVKNIKNFIDVQGFMKKSGPVPVSKNNVVLIEQFILGKGKRSLFRKSAIVAIPTIYGSLWMQDDLIHAYDNLLAREAFIWPSILWSQIRLAWLAHSAPITNSNRKLLRSMSDAEIYNIQNKSALMLGRAWYRFGDLKKAKYWWQFGMKSISQKNSASVRELGFHKLPIVSNGSISGQFRLRGRRNVQAVRVALFSVRSNKYLYQPNQGYYGFRLVQGKSLTKNGSFRFTNLGLGQYQLGFMLDGEILTLTKSMVKISNNPGTIRIDGKHRNINTGLINMKFKF